MLHLLMLFRGGAFGRGAGKTASSRLTQRRNTFGSLLSKKVETSQRDIFNILSQQTVMHVSAGNVNVRESVFANLKSDAEGGAIYANNEACRIFVVSSGFRFCYAKKGGGAIFYEGEQFNVNSSCFLGCHSNERGQTLHMSGPEKFEGFLDSSSITECGNNNKDHIGVVIFLPHGNIRINQINETSNHVKDIAACMCIAHNVHFALSYSTFVSCSGINMFWFHGMTEKDEISQCNIIRNKVSCLFVFEDCSATINSLTILGNIATSSYFTNGRVSVITSVFDVPFIPELFHNCEFTLNGCLFDAKTAFTRPLKRMETWNCWALGAPKPTPDATFALPIYDSDMVGYILMAGLLIVGAVSGLMGYIFVLLHSSKEIATAELNQLAPCESEQ